MRPPGKQVPPHQGLQHAALARRLAPYDRHLRELQVEVQFHLCYGGKACSRVYVAVGRELQSREGG